MSRIQQKIYQTYQEIRPNYETQEKKSVNIQAHWWLDRNIKINYYVQEKDI